MDFEPDDLTAVGTKYGDGYGLGLKQQAAGAKREIFLTVKRHEQRSLKCPRSEVQGLNERSPTSGSVSAGLALAGYQDGAARSALARVIGERVQDAGDGGVGSENPDHDDRDDRKGNCESNQQRAQVQPTFV